MLTIHQFDYHLPASLIAHKPAEIRDHSRMLVVNRQSGLITDHHFFDLPQIIDQNYLIVRNNTKVIPARIFGQKTTGGQVELLLIKRLAILPDGETWQCLTKPGLKPGQTITFPDSLLVAVCQSRNGYTQLIKFNQSSSTLFATLYQIGHTPIPPYIDWEKNDEQHLRDIYQTTFAKHQGSVAAPTAGLHFTKDLDQQLQKKGVDIAEVTLHVSLGTFLPVKAENIVNHQMHSEQFELTKQVAEQITQAKSQGKKILSVGTTTTRVLESCAKTQGMLTPQAGETDIYIYPEYQFKIVDSLITNFHLPKSTLLMLISAFTSFPQTQFENFHKSLVGLAYQLAIDKKYRFYSFGDAMLII